MLAGLLSAFFFAAAAGILCGPDFPGATFGEAAFPAAEPRATAPAESGFPDLALRAAPDDDPGDSAALAVLPDAWLAELGPGPAASEIPTEMLAATDALATVAAATASVSRDGPRRDSRA